MSWRRAVKQKKNNYPLGAWSKRRIWNATLNLLQLCLSLIEVTEIWKKEKNFIAIKNWGFSTSAHWSAITVNTHGNVQLLSVENEKTLDTTPNFIIICSQFLQYPFWYWCWNFYAQPNWWISWRVFEHLLHRVHLNRNLRWWWCFTKIQVEKKNLSQFVMMIHSRWRMACYLKREQITVSSKVGELSRPSENTSDFCCFPK